MTGVELYNTSSAYFLVCSPPKVKSPSIPIYLTPFIFFYLPSPLFPLVTAILLSVSVSFLSVCLVCLSLSILYPTYE